jgi:UDPglucose 6-dehydrogenase
MRIAHFGLGRLGLPYAAALAFLGHRVRAYDPRGDQEQRAESLRYEAGLREVLADSALPLWCYSEADQLDEVLEGAELVTVAVPTPCRAEFDATRPMADAFLDDDYSLDDAALRGVLVDLRSHGYLSGPIAVVSTTQPGTLREVCDDLGVGNRRLFHLPSFAGMGGVVPATRNPWHIVVGAADAGDLLLREARALVDGVWPGRLCSVVTWEESELAKLVVNTYAGMKLGLVGSITELCAELGADVRRVLHVLREDQSAPSPDYMSPGLGDGGGCHPRENAAMAMLAERCFESTRLVEANPYLDVLRYRERHAIFLARECEKALEGLPESAPVVIAGTAFKDDVSIETGSHSLLVAEFIRQGGEQIFLHDPLIGHSYHGDGPAVFLICRRHAFDVLERAPPGSVVVDPCDLVREAPPGCRLVKPGMK